MDEAEFDAIISRNDINKIRDLAELPDLSLELQRKLFGYSDSEVKNSLVKKIQDKAIVDSVLASGDPMAMRSAVVKFVGELSQTHALSTVKLKSFSKNGDLPQRSAYFAEVIAHHRFLLSSR